MKTIDEARDYLKKYRKQKIKNEDQLEFTIICIEEVARAAKKKGSTAFNELDKCQILSRYVPVTFASEMYQSQSTKYIADDMLGYARELGAKL